MRNPGSSPTIEAGDLRVEVERLTAEVERLSGELERAHEDFKQVLHGASHDLAEPLQIVLTYAELLASRSAGDLDERAERYLDGIQTGAMRIRQLIDGLSAYSALEKHRSELTEVDCSAIVEEILEELADRIDDSGATVTVEALPTVRGSEHELIELFENLIRNALEFRAGEPPRILISATAGNGDWRFCIRDNGIGIHPRQQERIFEIFQRLHTRDEHPGTGLGLAICRRIVERHGGRIWVDSRPGLGSSFLFTIKA